MDQSKLGNHKSPTGMTAQKLNELMYVDLD